MSTLSSFDPRENFLKIGSRLVYENNGLKDFIYSEADRANSEKKTSLGRAWIWLKNGYQLNLVRKEVESIANQSINNYLDSGKLELLKTNLQNLNAKIQRHNDKCFFGKIPFIAVSLTSQSVFNTIQSAIHKSNSIRFQVAQAVPSIHTSDQLIKNSQLSEEVSLIFEDLLEIEKGASILTEMPINCKPSFNNIDVFDGVHHKCYHLKYVDLSKSIQDKIKKMDKNAQKFAEELFHQISYRFKSEDCFFIKNAWEKLKTLNPDDLDKTEDFLKLFPEARFCPGALDNLEYWFMTSVILPLENLDQRFKTVTNGLKEKLGQKAVQFYDINYPLIIQEINKEFEKIIKHPIEQFSSVSLVEFEIAIVEYENKVNEYFKDFLVINPQFRKNVISYKEVLEDLMFVKSNMQLFHDTYHNANPNVGIPADNRCAINNLLKIVYKYNFLYEKFKVSYPNPFPASF